jgi:hypothetical protein
MPVPDEPERYELHLLAQAPELQGPRRLPDMRRVRGGNTKQRAKVRRK